jgi:PhoPQ-activated pathogenicity-related protein
LAEDESPDSPTLALFGVAMLLPLTVLAAALTAPNLPTELNDYVSQPDPTSAWEFVSKTETPAGDIFDLKLTSQTWHDIRWDHALQVFLPAGVRPTSTVVLWNQGGRPDPTSTLLGLTLAGKSKAPVAFLYGVPSQPHFGGKKEDALIAETFVRAIETGDSTWPLLFPMVKSVLAAMTAVQEFAAKEWDGHQVTHFVVTGASKRGWTAWLTAATGDPRVKAIAPMVIDFLNFPEQMQNQVRAFGKPSEMIRDYTDRGLVPIPNTPNAQRLWRAVDPFTYRDHLALPKLIVNGTNDPYWPLDALNSYWHDLPGEKYVLYVPNAGHGLSERIDEKGHVSRERVVNTLSAFCRCQVHGSTMPKLTWDFADGPDGLRIGGTSKPYPKARREWGATSQTRDFRQARWTTGSADTHEVLGGPQSVSFHTTCARPAMGFKAVFIECEYVLDGLPFTLSSPIRVLEAKAP